MRRSRAVLASFAAVATALPLAVLGGAAAGAGTQPYTVRTLHFAVTVGPANDQHCDIVGDLYTPSGASPSARVPAILTTNGFGGSKDDQAGIGRAFAARGYVVLSYSGLGFGGSSCKITLDDPDYDGKAARQLISFLGGADGIAFADAAHTQPVAGLEDVIHDARDHDGVAQTYDPRVGMVGGSYGGGIQFATAAVDPRLDTIVPLITWNDLSYSLDPNNTAQTSGVSSPTPGAIKLAWGLLFSADGALVAQAQYPPQPTDLASRELACPNFADFVCPALATGATLGYLLPDATAALRHASVVSFMSQVRIPTLLVQGENDTLFNLNEAVATYDALRAQHTPVKMIWQSWGHSDSTPAPGELDLNNPDPATQYETARIADWFDHYLKGAAVSTGPDFAYYRDWISYSGIATPAYGTAAAFPVGRTRSLYLSGDGSLATSPAAVTAGSLSLLTPPAGLPTSIDPLDVIGGEVPAGLDNTDLPGTAATWTGAPLQAPVDVAGIPTLALRVSAPTAALSQLAGPSGDLVLFVKIEDVAPTGAVSTIHGLVAPIRIPDVTGAFTVRLPGIVHRFAAGHSIRLVVAGGSVNYRGGLTPTPVSIAGGIGQVLQLPVVG